MYLNYLLLTSPWCVLACERMKIFQFQRILTYSMWKEAQQEVRQHWFINSYRAAYIQVLHRVDWVRLTGLTVTRVVGSSPQGSPRAQLDGVEVRGPTSLVVPVDGMDTASVEAVKAPWAGVPGMGGGGSLPAGRPDTRGSRRWLLLDNPRHTNLDEIIRRRREHWGERCQ